MIKHTKKLLAQSLKIIFAVAIIYWLISSGKMNLAALKNLLTLQTALLGIALIFLNIFLMSERWRVLVHSQHLVTKSFPVFKLTLIGTFFNFAMPGGVGGDVIKAFYFTKENPGSRVIAITSVLMDRILGLFAMVLLALIVMLIDISHFLNVPSLVPLFWIICILAFGFSIALSLIFSQKLYKTNVLKKIISKLPLSEKLLKLYESIHLYGNDPKRLLYVIALSLLSQSCAILFLYMTGIATGFAEVPFKTFFLVAPIGFMATAIPISPAGVGVGQAAFYFLFNIYLGTKSEVGPTCITAFQVGSFIVSLLGAYFYLHRTDRTTAQEIEQA